MMIRRYAPSLVGDMEILARVASEAATSYSTPRGNKPSHRGPLLNSCIWAWRAATDRFPVKTRDTEDARSSSKIASVYKIMISALDAIDRQLRNGLPGQETSPCLSPRPYRLEAYLNAVRFQGGARRSRIGNSLSGGMVLRLTSLRRLTFGSTRKYA